MSIKINKEELSYASEWVIDRMINISMYCFGGYPGEAYYYKNAVFFLDPGNESPQYANITGYKKKDIIKLYRKYSAKCNGDIENYYEGDDIIDIISSKQLKGLI